MPARKLIRLAAIGLAAGVLLMAAPARAQPYLGWDFGGGFGIGIGAPPSAYNPCPDYGWPWYPYRCRYRYYHRPVHARPRPPAWVHPSPAG